MVADLWRSLRLRWFCGQDIRPTLHPDNWQGKLEGLQPIGGVGSPKHIADRPLPAAATAAQAKAQSAFPRMIDVAVQDKGVNPLGMPHAVVRIGVGGRLVAFAIPAFERMKALLRQDDPPGLAVMQESLLAQERRQHLDVFEGDFFCVE